MLTLMTKDRTRKIAAEGVLILVRLFSCSNNHADTLCIERVVNRFVISFHLRSTCEYSGFLTSIAFDLNLELQVVQIKHQVLIERRKQFNHLLFLHLLLPHHIHNPKSHWLHHHLHQPKSQCLYCHRRRHLHCHPPKSHLPQDHLHHPHHHPPDPNCHQSVQPLGMKVKLVNLQIQELPPQGTDKLKGEVLTFLPKVSQYLSISMSQFTVVAPPGIQLVKNTMFLLSVTVMYTMFEVFIVEFLCNFICHLVHW